MKSEKDQNSLDGYEAWEFDHVYKKKELVSKLRDLISHIEKGHLKIAVNESKDSNEGPLDIDFPSDEVFCTFEYDLEPMFIDEKAKKGYFGIKLFWSDLGIEKLIEEEGKLDELEEEDEEEDFDVDDNYEDLDET